MVSVQVISHAHRFWNSASLMLLFFPFLDNAANKAGAHRYRGPTDAQLSVQSLVEAPSPSCTDMLTAHIAVAGLSSLHGRATQQRSGSILLSHSQRNLKANTKKRKSRTPSPPKHVGLQTVGQATLHFPPIVDSVPAQRNARRRLSIWPIPHVNRDFF